MKSNVTACYMCSNPAESGEHVPPRCFFPKRKDLSNGEDLRINLKKVPSCHLHNSEKSKDDQYLLNVVTSLNLINEVGRNHYRKQIRRQNERNPSIIKRFAERVISMEPNLAFQIEMERLDSVLEHFGYALYFLHYSEKWTGESINYIPEFAARPSGSEEENIRLGAIKEIDIIFQNIAFHGENPLVFKYQTIELDNAKMMRAHFYEGCKICFEFPNDKLNLHITNRSSIAPSALDSF